VTDLDGFLDRMRFADLTKACSRPRLSEADVATLLHRFELFRSVTGEGDEAAGNEAAAS
jgi:hypothetical protein